MSMKQGINQIVDSFIGDKLIEARYIGQTKHFDAYTEITAPLPLGFDARAAGALKNYRIYGTAAGSGTATESGEPAGYKIPISLRSGVTENLYNDTETEWTVGVLDDNGQPTGSIASHYTTNFTSVKPDTSYYLRGVIGTLSSYHRVYFYDQTKNWLSRSEQQNDSKRTFITPVNCKYIRIQCYISIDSTSDWMITQGSTAPDHYIPHCYTSNYDLFLGDTKLGEDEYLDYQEQKIYKMVSGVLTPVDPPAPLPAIQAYKGENTISSTEEVGEMTVKGRARPYVYGFKIDQSVSDPATAVTYLADAVGKTPAAMGSTTFFYGDWEDAFFMPRPCMLKSDGTVDYYLDPDDYSKKADGTASDVGDLTYGGNAMMEWPKIWYKFEEDGDGNVYFFCSYAKVDDSYHCWCNYDASNNIIPHFYTAIYNGIIRDNKMRSLSGFRLTPAIGIIPAYDDTATYAVGALCKVSTTAYTCITPVSTAEPFDSSKWQEITPNNNGGTTGQTEVNAAVANNPANTNAWYTDVYSDRQLISALLILMGKSRNDQGVFGRGLDSGSQTAKQAYVTGTLDDKGLFWGVTANGNSAVKIFGMENWYGCVWRRTAGLIGITVDNVTKYAYKLTYGTADGSTAASYGSTSTGYLTTEGRPASHNWVKEMSAGKHGMLPKEVSSSSLYYTVYYYTGTGYALFGGASNNGLSVGSLYVYLSNAFSNASWTIAGALSCKPPKPSAS